MTSRVLDSMSLEAMAEIFGASSDPIRLSMLDQLSYGRWCVGELQEALGIAANLLSHHSRILREAGMVEATRRGRWVDYELLEGAAVTIASALPHSLVEAGVR